MILIFLRLETDHELLQRCLDKLGRSGQRAIDLCGLCGKALDDEADALQLPRRIIEDSTEPKVRCSCTSYLRVFHWDGTSEIKPQRNPYCPIHSGVRATNIHIWLDSIA